jgi:hypothetical protein
LDPNALVFSSAFFIKGEKAFEYNSFMVYPIQSLEPVDYLVIGHLTIDITHQGPQLGGTVAYAGLTARALGLRVGIVTSWGTELPLEALNQIPVISYPSDASTTFENIETAQGRLQYVHNVASNLDLNLIPEPWRKSPIVHLAPVAQEVEPNLVRGFPSAMIGVTPQGWLRAWNADGSVYSTEWPEASFVLQKANATVISFEDIAMDEGRLEEIAASCHILAVTEGEKGCRVYWNGDVRRFHAVQFEVFDPTGAGDIFAAAFFVRLFDTHDPWEAGRFATQLASISITRPGLSGIPTQEEIRECSVEVL